MQRAPDVDPNAGGLGELERRARSDRAPPWDRRSRASSRPRWRSVCDKMRLSSRSRASASAASKRVRASPRCAVEARRFAELRQQERLQRQGADALRLGERRFPDAMRAVDVAALEGEHAEDVVALGDARLIAERAPQLERLAVAGLGRVEEAAVALDVADVDQRHGDGAPIAEAPPRLQRRRRAVERLVVARQQPQDLADVVERAGDAALVARLLEQLEAALEILERHRQLALLPVDAPHLVERDRRLGARGDHPGQAQHALERGERRVELALELKDRAEVVPQVDARGEVALAEAVERRVVQAHRLVVEVARARRVGGAAVAQRRAVAVAGALEVAPDLFLLLFAAAGRAQLEPLRDQLVVAAARGAVDAVVDHVPPRRIGEAILALARDRRVRLLDDEAAPAELGERGSRPRRACDRRRPRPRPASARRDRRRRPSV